jgi:hypothetical protein
MRRRQAVETAELPGAASQPLPALADAPSAMQRSVEGSTRM